MFQLAWLFSWELVLQYLWVLVSLWMWEQVSPDRNTGRWMVARIGYIHPL